MSCLPSTVKLAILLLERDINNFRQSFKSSFCSWMNFIIYCYIILFSWNIDHDSYRNITLVCIFRGGNWGASFLRGLQESGDKSFISGLESGPGSANVFSGMESVGANFLRRWRKWWSREVFSFQNWEAKIKTVI